MHRHSGTHLTNKELTTIASTLAAASTDDAASQADNRIIRLEEDAEYSWILYTFENPRRAFLNRLINLTGHFCLPIFWLWLVGEQPRATRKLGLFQRWSPSLLVRTVSTLAGRDSNEFFEIAMCTEASCTPSAWSSALICSMSLIADQ